MSSAPQTTATSPALTSLNVGEVAALVHSQAETITELNHYIAWFERQVFGPRSEQLKVLEDPRQLLLGTAGAVPNEPAPSAAKPVAAHRRRRPTRDVAVAAGEADSLLFFARERVPVETIHVLPREVVDAAPAPEQYKVIGEKQSYRLARSAGQPRGASVRVASDHAPCRSAHIVAFRLALDADAVHLFGAQALAGEGRTVG